MATELMIRGEGKAHLSIGQLDGKISILCNAPLQNVIELDPFDVMQIVNFLAAWLKCSDEVEESGEGC